MSEKTTIVETPVTHEEETGYKGPTGPRIRCPICDWMPTQDNLWGCKCGHLWHTFDTGGVCPACLHQWMTTQCPRCKGWSAHSDWYEY